MKRRLLVGLALVGALTLSACGTRVEGADGRPVSANPGTGLGQVPPGAALSADGSTGPGTGSLGGPVTGSSGTGATGGSGAGTGTTGTGTTGTGTGTGTGAGNGSGGGPGGPARGVTDTTIKIGLPVETGSAAVADAFGISGFSTISGETIYQAIINDINKSGGVLGRKLEPVYHYVDTAQFLANPSQVVAEVCADYRDDRPVYAVIVGVPEPGLRKCLAEMGSPLWLTNGISGILSAKVYAEHGGSYLFAPTSITTERLAELFIASLEDRGFHDKWNTTTGGPGGIQATKLGVIHVDTPDNNAQYDAYERELAKYGRKFEEEVTYPQQADAALAATQSAVLRFKAAGVTHVYGASVFFLQAAEAQGYRPRYAYLPGLGAVGVANSPAVQMRGAMTVGWAPTNDVNQGQDPGDTAGASRCRATMKKAGMSTANRADAKLMYNLCDAVYSMVESLKAGGAPTVPALRKGLESLGKGFKTAYVFRSVLGPTRHAGIDSVRDIAFDSACSCLKYTSTKDRS